MCPPHRVNRWDTPSCRRALAMRWPPCFAGSIPAIVREVAAGPPSAGVPGTLSVPMSLCHRRDDARAGSSTETAEPAAPGRGPGGRDEPDWRTYDAIAEAYDRVHASQTALVATDLVGLAGVKPGTRV